MRRIIISLLLLILCQRAIAQETQPAFVFPTPTTYPAIVPVLSPAATWSLPHNATVWGLEVSPDGRHLYVVSSYNTTRIWPLLVYYWPEAFIGLVVLLIILAVRWTIRYPVSDSQPHCRGCSYQLTKIDSSHCPECGAELRTSGRIIGRPRRWVLACLLVLLAAQIVTSLAVPGFVPRDGAVSDWFDVDSPALFDWASPRGLSWITRHTSSVCEIVELNADTGAIERVIDRDFNWNVDRRPLISRDGRTLAAVDQFTIMAFDVSTGDRLFRSRPELGLAEVTIDSDNRTLVTHDYRGNLALVDLRTGKKQEIDRKGSWQLSHIEVVPYSCSVINYDYAFAASGQVLPDSKVQIWNLKCRLLEGEWPPPMDVNLNRPTRVTALGGKLIGLDGADELIQVDRLTQEKKIMRVPQGGAALGTDWDFSSDGRLLMVPNFKTGEVAVCDLEVGEIIAIITPVSAPGFDNWNLKVDGHARVFCGRFLPTGRLQILKFNLPKLADTERKPLH